MLSEADKSSPGSSPHYDASDQDTDNDSDSDREEHEGRKKDGQKKYALSAEILEDGLVRNQPRIEPQTFSPTLDELTNLPKYVKYMETKGAAKIGIAKIKVPDEWIPHNNGYNTANMNEITIQPIWQNITPLDEIGVFQTIADESHPRITVGEYR